MSTLQKIGGISSLICAATYLVSIGLLFTFLTPFQDPAHRIYAQFMDFYLTNQTFIFIWHLLMYLVNGIFLVFLALALYRPVEGWLHRPWARSRHLWADLGWPGVCERLYHPLRLGDHCGPLSQ